MQIYGKTRRDWGEERQRVAFTAPALYTRATRC